MFKRIKKAVKRLLVSKRGSSPVVSFVVLAPLILVVAFGISWLGHMADAQNVVEEAARAGARWLAAHPGDIDGAKARAAEVVEGATSGKYIAGGSIDNPNTSGKLIGKLAEINHKYYIVDRSLGSVRAKPANGSIKAAMDALLNRTVAADGTWRKANVFKVKVATTDPPETRTVNQTVPDQSGGGGGSEASGVQTVSQTRHPGPFPAAALSKYGDPPRGTDWGSYAQQSSGTVSTGGALKIQTYSHNTNQYKCEWVPPSGGKILQIHIKGESERNYDYGYVYGWNGSSWVQLAKECSPTSNAEYDKWIDVSSYNVTKLETRLTTDQTVLYNPTYVDVPEVMTDQSVANNTSPFDSNTWWIWGQGGANKCAPNGQEVQLSKSCFLTYYATYDAYAVADDHIKMQLVSQNYSDSDFLSGDAAWVNGKVPPFAKSLWLSKPGSYMEPEQIASTFTINAWNDYGPAAAIFTLKHTGWHWDSSYKGYLNWDNHYYYYPWVRVPTDQYITVTAKDSSGNPIPVWVWNNSTNFYGNGSVTFFANANLGSLYPAYLIHVGGASPYNDVRVTFSEPYSVICTDSTWQYTPVDGVSYAPVTLPTSVQPGVVFNAQVRVTNTGCKEWYGQTMPDWWWSSSYGRGITALSYHWYDQSGNLVTLDGLRTALPDVVNPGTSVDRTISIQAPSQPGTYKLVIDGVQEDVAWFGPVQGVNWPTVEAHIVVGGKQRDVYFSPAAIPEYMITGQPCTVRVTATNKGTMTWPMASFKLGYYWVDNNGKKISQTVYPLPSDVQPGSSVTLDMAVTAPSKPGAYSLVISMAFSTNASVIWWSEDTQNPCSYIKADVQVPDGDMLQGMVTYDGEDYWIGTTLLDSQGPDLSTLAGKDAIVWGEDTGPEQKIFIVSSIEEYFPDDWNAVVTFDPDKDVLCDDPKAGDPDAPAGDPAGQPRADGYAYCRVTYHYPVPLTGFWKMVSHAGVPLWRGEETPSRPLTGEAFFVSGETGE